MEGTWDEDATSLHTVDMNMWGPEPDCKIRKVPKMSADADVKTMFSAEQLEEQQRNRTREARIQMKPDLNWANKGDTSYSVALDEHIAGARATLKKIVLQFSKEHHQVSEVVVDFSDIVGTQGSVNSSRYMSSPKLTILCDGIKRVVECYYDVEMGNFADSKFNLSVAELVFFPPLAGPMGGFDAGAHVATVVPTFGGVGATLESSVMTAPQATGDDFSLYDGSNVKRTTVGNQTKSTSAAACSPFYAQLIPPSATGEGVHDGRNSNLGAVHFPTVSDTRSSEQVLFDNCDHLSRNLHFPLQPPAQGPNLIVNAGGAGDVADPATGTDDTSSAAQRVLPTTDLADSTKPPHYEAPEMTRFYDKSLQMACAQRAAANRGTSLTTMPAYSSFTVEPRRSNGSLLAINVTLEARS